MGATHARSDGRPMQPTEYPRQTPRHAAAAPTLGAPALLLVSLAGVALVVLSIALVAATNATGAVALALLVHALTTAVVVAASTKMLDNSDRSRT